MSSQEIFARHLMYSDLDCPAGLTARNGSDPLLRFTIHRNNVMGSLIDALAETFPVTLALVGKEFFHGMAKAFLLEHPPRTKVLAWLGDAFPDYISRFPHVGHLPYLADVARLEMCRTHAYHAADTSPLDMGGLGALTSARPMLLSIKLSLHPSLHLVQSRTAVFSIWAAHHGAMDFAAINPDMAETAMVFRRGLTVETLRLTTAEGRFFQHLLSMNSIASAIDHAIGFDVALDVPGLVALLVQQQLVTDYFY